MKMYKLFRGLFKASALTTIMFIMQACYGTPHPMDNFYEEDEEVTQVTDSIQEMELEMPSVVESE